MYLSSRRSDDADVIRARLRVLLEETGHRGGWVPADEDQHQDDADDGWAPDPPETAPARVEIAWNGGDDGLPRSIGRHRSPGPTARWDPGHRGARALWLTGLVAALLLVGWTWLDRPRVEPVPADPAGSATVDATAPAASAEPAAPAVGEVAETSATVVVSVVGLVTHPGLVTLASGSRVADAVEAAGGLLPEADPASFNLAAVVSDGQQIAVGVAGAAGGAPDAPSGSGAVGPSGSGQRVNLNTATATDLDALPGIGPVLAGRIVAYRTAEGPFTSVDQLDDVPGIGPAIAANLVDLVTV